MLDLFREYAHLRYRLLPYIYTYACIAAQTSLPILRPMVLEFPDDPLTYTMDLQYMFGAELLVAPIYNSTGERPVYLPEGHWIDFWTREVLTGLRTISVRAPLEKLPLYVRANALIPTVEPVLFTSDGPFEEITVDAYLLERGTFELQDTDGPTRISAELAGNQLRVTVEGARQQLALRLIPLAGVPTVAAVFVNDIQCIEGQDGANAWTRLQDGTVLVKWKN